MKFKEYISKKRPGINFNYKIYSIRDIMNPQFFPSKRFDFIADCLDLKKESHAKEVACVIFSDFMNMLMNDLIETGLFYFAFPSKFQEEKFGLIKIKNMNTIYPMFDILDKRNNHNVYSFQIYVKKNVTKMTKKIYYFRANSEIRKKMYDKVRNGHKY